MLEKLAAFLRTIVRPVVTMTMIVAATFMIAQSTEIPAWWQDLVIMIVSFWFGSRAAKSSGE